MPPQKNTLIFFVLKQIARCRNFEMIHKLKIKMLGRKYCIYIKQHEPKLIVNHQLPSIEMKPMKAEKDLLQFRDTYGIGDEYRKLISCCGFEIALLSYYCKTV